MLESQSLLDALLGWPLDRLAAEGAVGVAIGREIAVQGMAECSLVLASYTGLGPFPGRIGVLGPKRMDYGRVMGLVDQVARAVSELLSGPEPPPT
jgi:transcriptional regulator of heat shock response